MNGKDDTIKVRMTDSERALFESYVSKKPIYLEYGCGGSTEIAVALGCPIIVSVESDRSWIETLSQKPSLAPRVSNKSLIFMHADVGPVGDWGVPKDDSKIRNWPSYFMSPYNYDFSYDFILIDGRFRNACAYASWAFMRDDATLAVHDYTVRRHYYDIEKFFDLQDQADTLVILKKKKAVVMRSLYTSVLTSLFNP